MRKHTFLIRTVALLCALCLVLGGCSGTSSSTELSETGAQAARLALENLGSSTILTDVVEFSLDDFEGCACHVLLLKAGDDRFLAYSYDTGTIYTPASDAVWNYDGALSTEADRCTYLLWTMANHTAPYVNSDEVRTELSAAELAQVNLALTRGEIPTDTGSETLIHRLLKKFRKSDSTGTAVSEPQDESTIRPAETLPTQPAETLPAAAAETLPAAQALPEGTGTYRVMTYEGGSFTHEDQRTLSNEQIDFLTTADLETVREEISNVYDFAAWLIALNSTFQSNVTSNPSGQRTIGADFAFEWVSQYLTSAFAASLAVRILGDDIPGIGIVAAQVGENDGTFLCGNLIPADGGYYLVSFDALTDEWKIVTAAGAIIPEAFPPVWVDGAAGIVAFCQSADNPAGTTLTQAFYIPGDQEVVLDYADGLYAPKNPAGVQEFYRDETRAAELIAEKTGHIKPENIGSFDLSTKLGGTTLTPEEAYALLAMEPEQVKERVKTAADMLMLMLAGQYGDCLGDRTKTVNGQEWHYNLNAFQVMQTRTTNCGSAANLANYLLEGDYEEVGFILQAYFIGQGGGHVYNYFKYQGKYYIVDFSSYMFSNYRPEQQLPVMELDRLEDYGSRFSELYGDGVCMVLAHTSTGQHYPNVFDDQNKVYAIPAGTSYQLLYQSPAPDTYRLKEYPLDKSQLDWTTFGQP